MSLPASDNFNRANAPNLGANWTELEAVSHSIDANLARAFSTAIAYWNADAFTSDHYSQATIGFLASTSANVCTNISGSAGAENFYQWGGGGSEALYKFVVGGFTLLQSGGTATLNDVLRLEHQGTTLRCYINGVQQGADVTDAAVSGGAPGLATNTSGVDDWSGDNLVHGSAVLTGTAIGGINASDIVAGGKTVIATLTGDTYIAN